MSKDLYFRRVSYTVIDYDNNQLISKGGKEYKLGYSDYDFTNKISIENIID